MALVFVVEPLQGLSVGKAQITLCALQGLNRGLLIHTQDHGMVGRRQVNPHQVGGFGGKLRVGRDTPTVPPLQADPVARQRSPDLARRHIAQGSGDQMAAPTGVTGGGRLIEQGQDTPFRLLAITPPPAGSWSDPASRLARWAAKRWRHWLTVAGRLRNRCAIAAVVAPVAAARISWARRTRRCSVVEDRTQLSKVRRSSPLNSMRVACRIPQVYIMTVYYVTKY